MVASAPRAVVSAMCRAASRQIRRPRPPARSVGRQDARIHQDRGYAAAVLDEVIENVRYGLSVISAAGRMGNP
jgi:hypothetical protein